MGGCIIINTLRETISLVARSDLGVAVRLYGCAVADGANGNRHR